MTLKTYRAYTMAEALDAVKRDLGADAAILHTRSYKQGGFLRLRRKTIVEVTATTTDQAPTRRQAAASAPPRKPKPASTAARKAYGTASQQPSAGVRPAAVDPRLDLLAAIEEHRRSTVQASQTTPPPQVVQSGESPSSAPARRPTKSIAPPPKPLTVSPAATATRPSESEAAAVARRFVLRSAREPRPASSAAPAATAAAPAAMPAAPAMVPPLKDNPATRKMQEEMHAIREMVGRVLQQQASRPGRTPAMPQQLFEMYLKLVGQEVSEELAEQVVERVHRQLTPDGMSDPGRIRRAILTELESLVPVADEPIAPRPADDRPLTIALIGPTGVGKTTTLAKLAATFKLRRGQRVGLITSDTYRIAAVDQLRTYANIIGLPLKVVLTPSEMRQACHQLRDCDVILIDTAGRSQRDSDKLGELRQFIAAADPHEVHLVLSSTASERVLLQEAEAFSAVRADRIILTKLDEAVSFGVLVNVMQKVGKQLSFVTTGQEVPDHIEPGRADRLASLILGRDESGSPGATAAVPAP